MSNWLYSTIHELGIIPSSNRREFQRAVQNGKLNRQKGDKSGNKMAFFFPLKKNGFHPHVPQTLSILLLLPFHESLLGLFLDAQVQSF